MVPASVRGTSVVSGRYQRRACVLPASCVVPASYIYYITARVAAGIVHVEEGRVSLVINGRGGGRGG